VEGLGTEVRECGPRAVRARLQTGRVVDKNSHQKFGKLTGGLRIVRQEGKPHGTGAGSVPVHGLNRDPNGAVHGGRCESQITENSAKRDPPRRAS